MADRTLLRVALEALARGDLSRVRELLEYALASESAPSVWQVGSLMHDRWEIFGEARGGMGHVYFVHDREWDAQLAVKTLTLPAKLSADRAASLVRMFQRETQLWLDLGAHPNIVSAYYTLELDGSLRLFMEYVAGQTLAALLRVERLELPRVLDLAIQLANGMEYVHARDVVHRDLKPANCLLDEDEALRITDFGLGKQERVSAPAASPAVASTALAETSAEPPPQATMSRVAAGTPLYMAPEQWLALSEAGKASDVYAFGVMLFEMLVGAPPFVGDGELHLRTMHARGEPPAPTTAGAKSTPAIDELVLACLAKRPADRPTFAALRERLLAIHEDVTGTAYDRALSGGLEADEGGENNRAASYYAMGDVRQAQSILDAWLAHHPLALHPWINRQVIALDEGDVDPATVAGELRERMAAVHAAPVDRQIATIQQRLAPHLLVHPDGVGALTAGQGLVATACMDRRIRIFREHVLERTLVCDSPILALGGLEHERLVSVHLDGQIVEWEWTDGRGRALARMPGATAVGMFATGEVVVIGSEILIVYPDGTTRSLYSGSRARSIAIHPDGTRFAVGVDNCHVTLYGLDGSATPTGIRHSSAIVACAWTPAGDLLVGDTEDAMVWSFVDNEFRTGADLRGRNLRAAALSRDGTIAAFTDGNQIQLWDVVTAMPIRRLVGHRDAIHALCVDDHGWLVSSSSDGTVRRWELPRPSPALPPYPLVFHKRVTARQRIEHRVVRDRLVARLAAGDFAANAELDDLCARAPEYRRDPQLFLARAPLHPRARSKTLRDAWVVWQVPLDQPVAVAERGDELVAIAGQPASVVSLGFDGRQRDRSSTPRDGRRAALSLDGEHAIACGDREAWIWSTRTGTERCVLRGHDGWVDAVAFSADGTCALTASDDHTARLWDRETGAALGDPLDHPERVWSVATLDGDRVVTGCRDGVVRVWASSRSKRQLVAQLTREGETFGARGQLGPRGQTIAATIRIAGGAVTTLARNAGRCTTFAELPAHLDLAGVVFSPDETLLVTIGRSEPVRIWDVATGALLRQLGTATDARAAAFVAHGSALLVAHTASLALWQLDFKLEL